MKKLTTIILALASIVFMSLNAVPVYAVPAGGNPGTAGATTTGGGCPTNPSDAKTQVLVGINQTGGDCSDTQVNNTVDTIINILSYVTGIVAVIMIIVSGFKFVTANGDSGKVATARSTLIYALIGLGVAALAQFFVQFVLSSTAKP